MELDNTTNELKDIQKKSLEILKVFQEFCQKNNLRFYICGGCCIGAIRHKGFIPWDDDIDMFMPRKDYEKLKSLWIDQIDNNKYKYCKSDYDKFYRSLLTYISDEDTTFIKERQKDLDISHGVRIEILPLDGCPKSRIKRKIQIMWALIYQIFNNQESPTSKGKFLKLVGDLMLFIFKSWKSRCRIWKYAEKQMSKYDIEDCGKITELCARYQYMVNEYPKEIFEDVVYKEFEGMLVPLPKGYDKYLKMAFGDYMKLPSKDKQIPKHEAVKIDLKNSYKKYIMDIMKG